MTSHSTMRRAQWHMCTRGHMKRRTCSDGDSCKIVVADTDNAPGACDQTDRPLRHQLLFSDFVGLCDPERSAKVVVRLQNWRPFERLPHWLSRAHTPSSTSNLAVLQHVRPMQ